ncbi:MAG: 4Fe-4S binding protein [Acidobacteriota bacterium]|jgi:ferredoxin-type protein NapH|nr:4Fe-4S binding protein [Acidobacteriota bacterium]
MRRPRASVLRTASVLALLGLTVAGLATHTGVGTLCAFGYDTIAAVCPLGGLEAMLAGRTPLPRALVSLAGVILAAVLLGRVFCAWMCPAPLLRGWILGGAPAPPPAPEGLEAAAPPSEFHPAKGFPKVSLDSRHVVLGGALLSSAVFGFPVFCLVCPVGLVFASLVGLWRLVQYNEPSWSLLLLPALFVLEVVLCRKWCRKICPLGALLSLLGGLNLFTRPSVAPDACRRTSKGVDCTFCRDACPEGIDLHRASRSQPLSECTRCRECADACPAHAIAFTGARRGRRGTPPAAD